MAGSITASSPPIWWREDICAENNVHVSITNEAYYLSADGRLMPAKKNQAPPERRYFKQSRGKIAPHRNQWRAGCA